MTSMNFAAVYFGEDGIVRAIHCDARTEEEAIKEFEDWEEKQPTYVYLLEIKELF